MMETTFLEMDASIICLSLDILALLVQLFYPAALQIVEMDYERLEKCVMISTISITMGVQDVLLIQCINAMEVQFLLEIFVSKSLSL